MFIPPLPYTVTPNASSGEYRQLMPNSGMKKLLLPLSTEASMPACEPERDALRCGLNQESPSCHSVSRNDIAPGLVAPPKGSCATAMLPPPMPIDFIP